MSEQHNDPNNGDDQHHRQELGDLNDGAPFEYPRDGFQDDWRDDCIHDLDREDHR